MSDRRVYNVSELELRNGLQVDGYVLKSSGGSELLRWDESNGEWVVKNGNLDMSGNRLEGLLAADSGDDAMRRDNILSEFVDAGGDSMSGNLDMGGNEIKNVDSLSNGTANTLEIGSGGNVEIPNGNLDVSSPSNSDHTVDVGGSMGVEGNLDMNGNNIQNVDSLTGSCPSGYIWVPGSSKHGTQPGFCVMKFEAKDDGSGNPVSTATDSLWLNINWFQAKKQCRQLGDDYHLITEAEWMTIVDNAMRQQGNWADGTIGSKVSNGGGLYRGNVGQSDSVSYDASSDRDTRAVSNRPRKAYFKLSNGNRVYDISGNVWEWTQGYMTTNGVPEPGNNGWTEYTAITNFRSMEDEKPMNPAWNSTNGIGKIYLDQSPFGVSKTDGNIHAVQRGGDWDNGARAGALSVTLYNAPSDSYSNFGFRCAVS
ncbi:MAG: SUMF1/EgtB/PvdO family nonheme iron enzyme [Candidatus Nanohaloarchaea archaeon]